VNVLSGTALLFTELLVVLGDELVRPVEVLLGDSAFVGGVSAPEEGV
jgi:hypothetical protein